MVSPTLDTWLLQGATEAAGVERRPRGDLNTTVPQQGVVMKWGSASSPRLRWQDERWWPQVVAGRVRLGMRKKFFAERVVMCCQSCPWSDGVHGAEEM